MKRILIGLVAVWQLSSTAVAQESGEPRRIQRAAYDARPIDKRAEAPPTPAVDVPIQQVGKQFRLLGKLNLPLGEVARVQGLVVPGAGQGYDEGLNVRVFRINGEATQQFIQIKLSDYYGREELPVQPGATCELEGFETGGFIGVPAEAAKRGGAVAQTTGHQFVHEFKVIQANEIKLQPFTPADFLGREMLVQGQAVSEGGSAYIAANKWKLLIDNGTPWPKNTEGKTVEARGVIQTIGKTTTYRLENGGKNNNARLVNLTDQVGKPVSLRGQIVEKKGEPYFRYRGQVLFVDGLKTLISQTGLNQEALVSGTLDAVSVKSESPTGATEVRTAYFVRKPTLKPADPLLAIERAEPIE